MMRTSPMALMALMALSGSIVVETGCKSAPTPPTQYGVRNSDGSITNPDGSVTYPVGVTPPGSAVPATSPVTAPAGSNAANTSVANTSAPVQTSPSAAQGTPLQPPQTQSAPVQQGYSAPSAPAAPVRLTVPAGTTVRVRLNGGLAASRNEVGDRFSGTLSSPVVVRGTTVYQAGTPVSGEVVASKGKGRFKGAGALGIELTAIGNNRVESSEYEKVEKGRGKRTAGFIGGGGGLGALIGGLAGGGKGALIGGLAGAGAGTAATAYTGSRDVVIPAESRINFTLRSSFTR